MTQNGLCYHPPTPGLDLTQATLKNQSGVSCLQVNDSLKKLCFMC